MRELAHPPKPPHQEMFFSFEHHRRCLWAKARAWSGWVLCGVSQEGKWGTVRAHQRLRVYEEWVQILMVEQGSRGWAGKLWASGAAQWMAESGPGTSQSLSPEEGLSREISFLQWETGSSWNEKHLGTPGARGSSTHTCLQETGSHHPSSKPQWPEIYVWDKIKTHSMFSSMITENARFIFGNFKDAIILHYRLHYSISSFINDIHTYWVPSI